MPYRVKDVSLSSTGNSTLIATDTKHPDENSKYNLLNLFYKHSPEAPAPQAGDTIECEPVPNKDNF